MARPCGCVDLLLMLKLCFFENSFNKYCSKQLLYEVGGGGHSSLMRRGYGPAKGNVVCADRAHILPHAAAEKGTDGAKEGRL